MHRIHSIASKISLCAASVRALLISMAAAAETFQAPSYVPGTKFVFAAFAFVAASFVSTAMAAEQTVFEQPTFQPGTEFEFSFLSWPYINDYKKHYIMKFRGMTEDGDYDFGSYKVSPYLEVQKKGKRFWGWKPVKFPIKLGHSEDIPEFTVHIARSACDVTNTLTRSYGSETKELAIAGGKLNVIPVTVEGTQDIECPGWSGDGDVKITLFYAPKLGVIVSRVFYRDVNSDQKGGGKRRLKSFKIPR